MKRYFVAFGLAVAAIACQDQTHGAQGRSSADTTANLTRAQSDAQKQAADARSSAAQAQANAEKKMADARTNAAQAQADAQKKEQQAQTDASQQLQSAHQKEQQAQQKAQSAQQDLTTKQNDAQASASSPTSVTGTVTQLSSDSLHVKTDSGQDLALKLPTDSAQQVQPKQLKEGDEVRASYKQQDGDNIVQTIQVIRTLPEQNQNQQ